MESKQEEKFVLKQAEEDLKKKEEEKKKEQEPAEANAKEKEKKGEKQEEKEKPKAEAAEKKEEKKREVVVERLYTIPIKRFLFDKPRMKRHTKHAGVVKAFAAKHLKTPESNVKIDSRVAIALTKTGRGKLLSELKVKVSKDKQGMVLVELAA